MAVGSITRFESSGSLDSELLDWIRILDLLLDWIRILDLVASWMCSCCWTRFDDYVGSEAAFIATGARFGGLQVCNFCRRTVSDFYTLDPVAQR